MTASIYGLCLFPLEFTDAADVDGRDSNDGWIAFQVVANSVAALSEINEVSEEDVMLVNSGTLNKLLTALNECTEYMNGLACGTCKVGNLYATP